MPRRILGTVSVAPMESTGLAEGFLTQCPRGDAQEATGVSRSTAQSTKWPNIVFCCNANELDVPKEGRGRYMCFQWPKMSARTLRSAQSYSRQVVASKGSPSYRRGRCSVLHRRRSFALLDSRPFRDAIRTMGFTRCSEEATANAVGFSWPSGIVWC